MLSPEEARAKLYPLGVSSVQLGEQNEVAHAQLGELAPLTLAPEQGLG